MKYPMLMLPAYKNYLWGGSRLAEDYNKNTELRPLAESWEVSCHPDGPSRIGNGPYTGKTLTEVLNQNPAWIGRQFQNAQDFPVLIKLIDAQDKLSLQVHPDNAWAMEHEGQQGKNEMWYVLDSKPGAELILGLKRPLSKENLKAAIKNNTILDLVQRVPVKKGDCYCIPAGMLHGIGKGVIIAEIQQNSNVTYRVYDYNRRDSSGKLRPLHIDKAVQVINPSLNPQNTAQCKPLDYSGYSSKQLTNWKWFSAQVFDVKEAVTLPVSEYFSCVTILSGTFHLEHNIECRRLNKGQSLFIPAETEGCTMTGKGQLLYTAVKGQPVSE